MSNSRPILLILPLLLLLSLSSLAMSPPPMPHANPAYGGGTPIPPPTPPTSTPNPGGGAVVNSISNIFHHLVFPADTISQALTRVFNKAANREASLMDQEVTRWTKVIGEIVQAPSKGEYSKVAQSSLSVAAALAPALFLLRLALYHWGRLLGEDDSAMRVIGDWVTAGALAVASGPFLDLIIRLGWWMVGRVIGETGGLAVNFVKSTTATSVVIGIASQTFLGGLVTVGLSIGSLIAIGGMLFAFASANAVLFILAVLAPPLAVASVLPQARWLRSLWMKAVILIALLPIVAGGVFKAGLAASFIFNKPGLLSALIHVIWLWGAVGILLSLAGILGKMTISTTADAFGQMLKAVQQVVAIGALAASGVGAAGAGAIGAGAAGAGTGAAGAAAGGGGLSGGGGAAAAMNHLNAAQQLNQTANTYSALGLHAPAAYNRSLAHGQELAARQAELGERMERFNGVQPQHRSQDYGFSPTVNATIQANFHGTTQDFQRGFEGLSPHISQHGLDPDLVASQYPEDTAHLVQAYLMHGDEISRAPDPLHRAAELGNASQLQGMITFMSMNRGDDQST